MRSRSLSVAETLALKGLNLAYMDKKDEAFDCVKRGVKADVTGFTCTALIYLIFLPHTHTHSLVRLANARSCASAIQRAP